MRVFTRAELRSGPALGLVLLCSAVAFLFTFTTRGHGADAGAQLRGVDCSQVPGRVRLELSARELQVVRAHVTTAHTGRRSAPRGSLTRQLELRWTFRLLSPDGVEDRVEIICSAPGTTPEPGLLKVLAVDQTYRARKRRGGFEYEDPFPVYRGSIGNVAYGSYLVRWLDPASRKDLSKGPNMPADMDRAIASAMDGAPPAGPQAVNPEKWAKTQ